MVTKFNEYILNENNTVKLTYSEYLAGLEDYLMRFIGMDENQVNDYLSYFHGKSYIEDCWRNGYTYKDCVDSLKINGEIKWYK